jgi:hypothetical protein
VTPEREMHARISPNGRYVAYLSTESGDPQIMIKRFPSGEGKWQVSTEGGTAVQWARDGNSLFYRQVWCDIVEVQVETESNLVLGTPKKIIDCGDLNLASRLYRCYTVSHDGTQLLMQQSVTPDLNTIEIGITVVENWASEFADKGSR